MTASSPTLLNAAARTLLAGERHVSDLLNNRQRRNGVPWVGLRPEDNRDLLNEVCRIVEAKPDGLARLWRKRGQASSDAGDTADRASVSEASELISFA